MKLRSLYRTTMSSTPELSPPSSAASSSDESFYSALLTSPYPPLLPPPACISFEFPKSMLQCDNTKHSYGTPKSIYPSPTYTSEPIPWNQSPDYNPKSILDNTSSRQQRKRDLLPQPLCRSRTTPPQSFVEISEILPVRSVWFRMDSTTYILL